MVKKEEDGEGTGEEVRPLERLLRVADLLRYEDKFRNVLKLRHAGDLQYVDEVDLSGIGMSRPEQKRLRQEYQKMFPKIGVFGKLKKAFTKNENGTGASNFRDDAKNEQHVIPLEKITLTKELGKGEFGAVWQASWNNGPAEKDTVQVAVKVISTGKLVNCTTSFLSEAAIMTRMRHENVVQLYGVVLDTKQVMLVSELATCGSLLECLHKPALRDSFPVDVLCDYAFQIASGMAYLESQRLIHRDLAARNVLVFGPKKVKISDFGLSRSLGVGEDYYRSEFSPTLKLPIAWCAPECINFLKFTSASDVWSYGVTIWEMFTYGKMPWQGLNGAEILNAVDRQQKHLDRPSCCPDDMWDLMKDCWHHTPERRLTFKQIVDGFPDRIPQMVKAIRDCRDQADDHLQFKKDDLIIVLCRRPTAYPDGFYWLGSMKNGKVGLFRPIDTVAHLGAECPATVKISTSAPQNGKETKDKKKEWKESDRESKKLLISEPQGDLRHMCHVGIDGTAIGLLQIDKKDLVKGTPVQSNSISPGTTIRSITPSTTNQTGSEGSSSIGSPATVSRNDRVTFRDRHTVISAPGSRAPSQPGMIVTTRGSVEPSAPPLSVPNSLTRTEVAQLNEKLLDESLYVLNGSIDSLTNSMHRSSHSANFGSDEFLQPRRSPNRQPPICAVYARTPENAAVSHPSTSDRILMDEVAHLDRDLTDFSLASLGGSDYSDTRPLIPVSPTQTLEIKRSSGSDLGHSCSSSPPTVRLMSEEEIARWHDKESKQHNKIDKKLEETNRRSSAEQKDVQGTANGTASRSNPPDWSPEAQEAYKLLVECGDTLQKEAKAASISPRNRPSSAPNSSRSSTDERPIAKINATRVSCDSTTSTLNSAHVKHEGSTFIARPALPPKSYVNTEAIKPPELPPKKTNKVSPAAAADSGYDNLNGINQSQELKNNNNKLPPPVPPKPKTRTNPPSTSSSIDHTKKGFAPIIARSSLFNGTKIEEIIKY
ncbi:unnamed protein product, partial [Mesorhabditis belari]|uniref:non-specific protein-tyrosine kinase n=1 Tax=Mesorhabditis belari TaxID=2138241 RepID=A0AAF3J2H2_9BILA